MIRSFTLILSLVLLFPIYCFGQHDNAFPTVLIPADAEASGMGTASMANITDNPLSIITNPAHLSIISNDLFVSYGYNRSDWAPNNDYSFHPPYQSYAIMAGFPLQKFFDQAPPIIIGLGYSRIYLDRGDWIFYNEGLRAIPIFGCFETSSHYTITLGINYWIKASLGYTFKSIYSQNFALHNWVYSLSTDTLLVNAYDVGLLLEVPVIDILTKLQRHPLELNQNTKPIFDIQIGLSQNNMGSFNVNYQGLEPPPRTARAGISIKFGIDYSLHDINIQPVVLKWSSEISDPLIDPAFTDTIFDSQGNVIEMQFHPAIRSNSSGLGKIKFFDNVILGKYNNEVMLAKGWELTFFNVLSLRGGRYVEDPQLGASRFNTSGWGVRFSGIRDCLKAFNCYPADKNLFGYVANHLNVGYDHSLWNTDDAFNPLSGTTFNSGTLSILL